METVSDRKLAIRTVLFAVVGYAIEQTDRAHVAFAKFLSELQSNDAVHGLAVIGDMLVLSALLACARKASPPIAA